MFKERYWLVLGVISYLAILIYSLALSLENTSFIINLQVFFDWVAASIIYFFMGASIGFTIDYFRSKKSRSIPLWFYLTFMLWILAIILSIIFSTNLRLFLSFIFPLAYGIFFTGAAYVTLLPDFFKEFYFAKLYFDLLVIFLFGIWIYLTLKLDKPCLENTSLFALFIILVIGMIKSIMIFLL